MILLTSENKVPLQVFLKKLIVEKNLGGESVGLVTIDTLASQQTIIYAIIILSIVPMLIVYPFIQKYFKKGVMVGSVKG